MPDRELDRFVAAKQANTQSVTATLIADKNRPESFLISVTNNSNKAIRFLDIREGAGDCGDFYEVTVEIDGKTYGSNGLCVYAPSSTPFVVVLEPGAT